MEKESTAKAVYTIGALSTENFRIATTCAKSIVKELASAFRQANLSISQFANWLSANESESAKFVRTSVLKASERGEIFNQIRNLYPYKDESGKLVRKVTLCKGLQTIEQIDNFSEQILTAIIERTYLRSMKPQILPQYFTADKAGKIIEIDEVTATEMIAAAKADKEAAKADKEAKLAKFERVYNELQGLAAVAVKATEKESKANLLDMLSKFIEIVNS